MITNLATHHFCCQKPIIIQVHSVNHFLVRYSVLFHKIKILQFIDLQIFIKVIGEPGRFFARTAHAQPAQKRVRILVKMGYKVCFL